MKKDINKKRRSINGWKLTAILSLIVNGIVALLLTIGLAQPKASVKISAYNEVYDTSKIVLTTANINANVDYYLYYDWVNQSVEGSDTLYYFPISNDVDNFQYNQPLGSFGKSFVLDNFNYLTLLIYKLSNYEIMFGFYGFDITNETYGTRIVYYYHIQTEPRSLFLGAYTPSNATYNTAELRSRFRSLFDGTIPISPSQKFVCGYLSQYSVQNLEVGLKTDSNIALNQTDFSPYSFGVYGMSDIEQVDYTYLQSTLIHSDSSLLDVSQQFALMPLLNGSFYAKEQYSALLVGVWKEIYWPQFDTVSATPVYYDVLFNGQKLDKSNGYYYYLESINFYNVGAEELGEVIYSVTSIDYAQEFQWSNGYCYYTTKLQSSALNPVVIRKVNLYPSQRVEWINFSNIFDITNHFYFGNGIIDNPSIGNDNNINGGNTAIGNVFVLIRNGFESVMPLLGLTILPNITIGMLLFLPLIGTIIIVIIKLVKR